METLDAFPIKRNSLFDPPEQLLESGGQGGGLARLVYPDGHTGWVVTGHALAKSILADRRFSSRFDLRRVPVRWPASDAVFGHPAPSGVFLGMDAPEHTRYRRALAREFSRQRMDALAPVVEKFVDVQLRKMVTAGPPADLVEVFEPIPVWTICDLLGIPVSQHERVHATFSIFHSLDASEEEATALVDEFRDYLWELVEEKRHSPSPDLISRLVASGHLSSREIVGTATHLISAGFETTANMLSLGALALLLRRDQWNLLKSSPEFLPNAVEELMRYLSIFQFSVTRAALEDVLVGSETISEGECVTISLLAANHDDTWTDEPNVLDVRRDGAGGHLGFGHGVHACIGAPLARVQLRAGYGELLRRFPSLRLSVDSDELRMREDMATYGVHSLPVEW